jgi:hypothetical protein
VARSPGIAADLFWANDCCCGGHSVVADRNDDILSDGEILMTNTAIIRDAYGVPAMFVGSKTGKEDAPFVFIRVGDEERRMRWAEWDALPAWSGTRPSWAAKH